MLPLASSPLRISRPPATLVALGWKLALLVVTLIVGSSSLFSGSAQAAEASAQAAERSATQAETTQEEATPQHEADEVRGAAAEDVAGFLEDGPAGMCGALAQSIEGVAPLVAPETPSIRGCQDATLKIADSPSPEPAPTLSPVQQQAQAALVVSFWSAAVARESEVLPRSLPATPIGDERERLLLRPPHCQLTS